MPESAFIERVSLHRPVYNGEPAASESILAQAYENFELIIPDNASTDWAEESKLC